MILQYSLFLLLLTTSLIDAISFNTSLDLSSTLGPLYTGTVYLGTDAYLPPDPVFSLSTNLTIDGELRVGSSSGKPTLDIEDGTTLEVKRFFSYHSTVQGNGMLVTTQRMIVSVAGTSIHNHVQARRELSVSAPLTVESGGYLETFSDSEINLQDNIFVRRNAEFVVNTDIAGLSAVVVEGSLSMLADNMTVFVPLELATNSDILVTGHALFKESVSLNGSLSIYGSMTVEDSVTGTGYLIVTSEFEARRSSWQYVNIYPEIHFSGSRLSLDETIVYGNLIIYTDTVLSSGSCFLNNIELGSAQLVITSNVRSYGNITGTGSMLVLGQMTFSPNGDYQNVINVELVSQSSLEISNAVVFKPIYNNGTLELVDVVLKSSLSGTGSVSLDFVSISSDALVTIENEVDIESEGGFLKIDTDTLFKNTILISGGGLWISQHANVTVLSTVEVFYFVPKEEKEFPVRYSIFVEEGNHLFIPSLIVPSPLDILGNVSCNSLSVSGNLYVNGSFHIKELLSGSGKLVFQTQDASAMSAISSLSEFGYLDLLENSYVTQTSSSNVSIISLLVDDNSQLHIDGHFSVDEGIYVNKSSTLSISSTGQVSSGSISFSDSSSLKITTTPQGSIISINGEALFGGHLAVETTVSFTNTTRLIFMEYGSSSSAFSSVTVNGNGDDYEVVYGASEAYIKRKGQTSISSASGTGSTTSGNMTQSSTSGNTESTTSDENISVSMVAGFLLLIAVFLV